MNIENASPPTPSASRSCLSFAQALSAGELDAAASCFARDGCLITPDATTIHGRDGIRGVLGQMVIRRTEIQVELSTAVGTGDVILVHQRWRISSGERKGARIAQTLHPTLVLKLIEDTWKLAIAAPWGCNHRASDALG
ncbi:MAG TPA: nuclear transport factor 2 family protein [Solirubrobacterales bacterium]